MPVVRVINISACLLVKAAGQKRVIHKSGISLPVGLSYTNVGQVANENSSFFVSYRWRQDAVFLTILNSLLGLPFLGMPFGIARVIFIYYNMSDVTKIPNREYDTNNRNHKCLSQFPLIEKPVRHN